MVGLLTGVLGDGPQSAILPDKITKFLPFPIDNSEDSWDTCDMARPIKHWHKYRYDESLHKWVRKKRYKHPVITVVKLDPDQALLAICQVNGGYWDRTANVCVGIQGTTGGNCNRSVRNRRNAANVFNILSAQPS